MADANDRISFIDWTPPLTHRWIDEIAKSDRDFQWILVKREGASWDELRAWINDDGQAPAGRPDAMWSRLLHRLVSVQVIGLRALVGTVEEITPETIVLVEEGAPVMIPKVAIAWVQLPAAWRDAPEAP